MNLILLYQILIAFLGMILVIYGKFITTPGENEFSWSLFWKENKRSFLLTIIGIPLLFCTIAIVPEAGNLIKTITGLEINQSEITNLSALTFGVMLYSSIRNINKKNALPK